MENSFEFLNLVMDAIADQIAVIDERGQIVYVNQSWTCFGKSDQKPDDCDWASFNYLAVCERAAENGDTFGQDASAGIRAVMAQQEASFELEYPCHSPHQKRWFIMRVTPFSLRGQQFLVITHQNVTERKLAEQKAERLAHIDALTEISNRRAFDAVLKTQWQVCAELKQPLCLAFIDLDHFKILNDTYGHLEGDECLSRFAELLEGLTRSDDQFCARCGGEEFAIIWTNTPFEQAVQSAQALLQALREWALPNEYSPIAPYLTASIGLAETIPTNKRCSSEFFNRVDALLYEAKESGRDQLVSAKLV